MATLSAWNHSDEEILPDCWQVPEYRRLPVPTPPRENEVLPARRLEPGECH
jgi:hypothetical protein